MMAPKQPTGNGSIRILIRTGAFLDLFLIFGADLGAIAGLERWVMRRRRAASYVDTDDDRGSGGCPEAAESAS